MKIRELIDKAEIKAGGVSKLAARFGWNLGNVARAKKSGKLPPEKAIELAEYVGACKEIAYLEALRAQEISEKERAVLGKLLAGFKAGAAALTIALALAASAFPSKKAYAGNGIGERHVIYNVFKKLFSIFRNITKNPNREAGRGKNVRAVGADDRRRFCL